MTRLRLAGLVAAATIALVPVAATASDQDDALKLAQRVASRGFIDATVTLHALPKDFPASIPLPKATLLGSVVETMRQGSWMTAGSHTVGTTLTVAPPMTLYYDAPAGRAAAVTAYEGALSQAGWKPAPDFLRGMLIQQGGFTLPFPKLKQWCSPSEPRTALSITEAQDPSGFELSIASADAGTVPQCRDGASPFDVFRQRSPLPTFTAPSGIVITASGPASDGSTTGARVTSSLGLAAVFESFAKQLRDAGWTPKGSASSAGLQAQTFTKTVDGVPYVVLLTIHALDATHYVALADVSNTR